MRRIPYRTLCPTDEQIHRKLLAIERARKRGNVKPCPAIVNGVVCGREFISVHKQDVACSTMHGQIVNEQRRKAKP